MKRCPNCRSTYTDDGLRFCLTDGSELVPMDAEQEPVLGSRGKALQPDISHAPSYSAGQVARSPSGGRVFGKVIAIAGVLGVLLVIGLIAFVLVIYLASRAKTVDNGSGNKTPAASPSVSPTPDSEKQRLQDELANVQKRLAEEQKNANRAVNEPRNPTSPGTVTARVNSPNDGFLALRAQPDADRGERIAKIPHGDVITIENCDRNKVTIGGRSGRWCLVSWNGYEGYVFDAWVIY